MTTPEVLKTRLLARRRIEGDHWLWTGSIHQNGYGKVCIDKRQYWVHRLSAHLFLGLTLEDRSQQANHQRTCLHRHCFNPEHLYVGSHNENMADSTALGRHVSAQSAKTHCSNGHPFTPDNVYIHVNKQGHHRRDCRECNREKDRKNYPELRMARALLVA